MEMANYKYVYVKCVSFKTISADRLTNKCKNKVTKKLLIAR